jgi:hypothetical protein
VFGHAGILAFALHPAGDEKNHQYNGENDQADGVRVIPNALYARLCVAVENDKLFNYINGLAEGVGFEPTVPLRARRFSRPVP